MKKKKQKDTATSKDFTYDHIGKVGLKKKSSSKLQKMHKANKSMLISIVGDDTANKILSNMFPSPIKGYKKGKPMTIGQLKTLPKNTTIYVKYLDEDNHLRTNDFHTYGGYDNGEGWTTDGFTFPLEDFNADEQIVNLNNCDWSFTVCEAIKIK